jgi:hypothetical protein
MSLTTSSTIPTRHAVRAVRTRTRVWPVGVAAGVAAAIATSLVALVASAAGVPMRAGNIGADTADSINALTFALATWGCAAIGTFLAVVLARRANHPAHTFVVTTVVVTAISLASPILAGATTAATKTTLVVAHLVAAVIVIPTLARRLG